MILLLLYILVYMTNLFLTLSLVSLSYGVYVYVAYAVLSTFIHIRLAIYCRDGD